MKQKYFLSAMSILIISFTPLAQADSNSESIKRAVAHLSGCRNFIRFDSHNVYTSSKDFNPRAESLNKYSYFLKYISISSLIENKVVLNDVAFDALSVGPLTYVLTPSGIEEWDLPQSKRQGLYATHTLSRSLNKKEQPTAFAKYDNKLVISHGRLGVSFFDLSSKKITKIFPLAVSQNPLESVATGVSVSDHYAFVTMDNFSLVEEHQKAAFRGIIVIDLKTETIVTELDGMIPGSDSILSDGRVAIVSFYGNPLWKYSLDALISSKKIPSPLKRIWKFPIQGNPTGKASMDDKYYYTCFSRAPQPHQGPYFYNVPMVLDRRALMID